MAVENLGADGVGLLFKLGGRGKVGKEETDDDEEENGENDARGKNGTTGSSRRTGAVACPLDLCEAPWSCRVRATTKCRVSTPLR